MTYYLDLIDGRSIIVTEGQDVSELLNIQLWSAPIPAQLAGDVVGPFPNYVPKTDQERCLSGDTVIKTKNGHMTIKEICDSKWSIPVLTFNHVTHELEYKPIIGWSTMTRKNNWFKITTKSGKTLTVTGNHKVWIDDLECYRRVDELVIGNKLKIIP